MTAFTSSAEWESPSSDPNDETFGDVVVAVALEHAEEYGAVLVGEPSDVAVIGRRGAREGPRAIRESMAGVKTHHFEAGPIGSSGVVGTSGSVDANGSVAPIGDLGDLELPDADVSTVQDRAEAAAQAVYETGARPVFLGGDNSLTVANVSPLLADGSVGVVSLDAHLDCREPIDGPSSGTPYYQLHERGLDAFAVVGARHFETSSTYARFVEEQDGTVITAETVRWDLETGATRALEAMTGVDRIFLSLDVDVLDAAFAPGVSAPTPGGLTTAELYALLSRIAADERVAGFEVVECAPPLDRGGMTSDAAARAVAHVLAGWST
ncbi:formimidoylglutamase [Natronosalvus rutilus]|uniref:Formimidoylglutamase n=1 Tax=Natronosalvus rutilus TaxID=2953753 RepID=A0A9E7SSC6_9EURY|nr:formimidoylglutamase [Natronosalvus rutilus]UTF52359.1 formimidoylglutamase [Natronosalvus rutilus]